MFACVWDIDLLYSEGSAVSLKQISIFYSYQTGSAVDKLQLAVSFLSYHIPRSVKIQPVLADFFVFLRHHANCNFLLSFRFCHVD
jgi:hypothetical protein